MERAHPEYVHANIVSFSCPCVVQGASQSRYALLSAGLMNRFANCHHLFTSTATMLSASTTTASIGTPQPPPPRTAVTPTTTALSALTTTTSPPRPPHEQCPPLPPLPPRAPQPQPARWRRQRQRRRGAIADGQCHGCATTMHDDSGGGQG